MKATTISVIALAMTATTGLATAQEVASPQIDDFAPMTRSERLRHYLTGTFGRKAIARNAMQAELVRNLLEQNGLRATVGATHNPFPGLPIAPAEVFVERADEKHAREVIRRAEHVHRDDQTA